MLKGKINTEDFILQLSKNGNNYIVDPETGENVMVSKSVAAAWDDLDTVTVGERKFTKRTDEDGNLVDEEWSRLEIVGKGSIAKTHEKKTRNLKAVGDYYKARKAVLSEIEELGEETKKEINKVLGF